MTETPPLNIDYWSLQYAAQQDDEGAYIEALKSSSEPIDRAEMLWEWKDLSRGVDFDSIKEVVSNEELLDLVTKGPSDAVSALSERLIERGALKTRTVVTPAFLLHLTDSTQNSYSTQFPIFDVRCWVAYVYLTRFRDSEQALPSQATTSPERFGKFSAFFQHSIPESISGRKYEQALFQFGAYISSLPFDTIGEIDQHFKRLEMAVTHSRETNEFTLVRVL